MLRTLAAPALGAALALTVAIPAFAANPMVGGSEMFPEKTIVENAVNSKDHTTLVEAVKARVQALREADPGNTLPVPIDLVTTSASGLDPHISPAAARYQAPRVARLRQMPVDAVEVLIGQHTERPRLAVLGEPRVDVLALNLALDALRPLPSAGAKP